MYNKKITMQPKQTLNYVIYAGLFHRIVHCYMLLNFKP